MERLVLLHRQLSTLIVLRIHGLQVAQFVLELTVLFPQRIQLVKVLLFGLKTALELCLQGLDLTLPFLKI